MHPAHPVDASGTVTPGERARSFVITSAVLSALLLAACRASAQVDEVAVETVAAKAILRYRYTTGPLGISPEYSQSGTAPGGAVGSLRADAGNRALAAAIGAARVIRFSEARLCREGPCGLAEITALVTLSKPEMSASRATITATILQNQPDWYKGRQRLNYETWRYTLLLGAGGWTIVEQEQLGIS